MATGSGEGTVPFRDRAHGPSEKGWGGSQCARGEDIPAEGQPHEGPWMGTGTSRKTGRPPLLAQAGQGGAAGAQEPGHTGPPG